MIRFFIVNPTCFRKTELDFFVKCANINLLNPRQMSMRTCQILGGSSDLDDKFGFGMQTMVCKIEFGFERFDDQKRVHG
jgi:hypothetical protein